MSMNNNQGFGANNEFDRTCVALSFLYFSTMELNDLVEHVTAAFREQNGPLIDVTTAAFANRFNGLALGQMRDLIRTINLPDDVRGDVYRHTQRFLAPGVRGVFYVVYQLHENPGQDIPMEGLLGA